MKVRPLLNLGLRLGEGTGAICSLSHQSCFSVNMMNEMDNFAHASITNNILTMKLLASSFFSRLPFWKIADVPPVYFKRVVDYWPFVGWLTGGIMAGTLWITAELPVQIAVLMALAARLLVTGALHEDGLADFCDGFGGGTSRDKILSIMKDSHIGTYGVLGLLFYYD